MPITHLATATNIIWKLIKDYGHDPDPLFRKERIDPDLIKQPEARILFIKVVNLWKKAAEMIEDPCFALRAAEYWHPSYMNALGFAWLASNTLREALDRLALYLRIVTEGAEIVIEDNPEGLIVELKYKLGSKQPPTWADAASAILMTMCRINYGTELNPIIVHFVHDAPSCSEKYEAYFNSKVGFGSTKNSITFSHEDVDLPLPSSNPYLAGVNDQIVINYIGKLDEENIVNSVKAKIIDMLPSGKVTDEKVSNMLYMSVRTFQRKLREKGTTFRALLNETRKDLAKQYLNDPSIRLEEIAFLLGFSEYSVFSKAFKRWTGYSPSEVRA